MKFTSVGTFNQLHPTAQVMLDAPSYDPWDMSLKDNRIGFQRYQRDMSGPMAPIHSIETLMA